MEIRYKPDLEDIIELHLYMMSKNKKMMGSPKRPYIFKAVLILVIGVIYSANIEESWPIGVAAAAALVYFIIQVFSDQTQKTRNLFTLYYQDKDMRSFICEQSLVLNEEGLYSSSEYGYGLEKYELITEIEIVSDYGYVKLSGEKYIIIPKKKVISGSLEEWCAKLKEKIHPFVK